MISFLNEASRQLQPQVFAAVVQGSLFAALIGVVDLALGKRLRAGMRHALWMLVILKFLLPPTLTLPTSAAYWISRWSQHRIAAPRPQVIVQTEQNLPTGNRAAGVRALPETPKLPAPVPSLEVGAILGLVWISGSLALMGLMLRRHREIRRLVKESNQPTPALDEALAQAGRVVGIRALPSLRLTRENHSPAICGGGSPTLLLPQFLAESASASALRGILLHELVHLRRRDLWLNALQLLTQALWWWNPVVWLTNARIRALREFAVDQEVQHLHGTSDPMAYPAALVEVARQCLTRPQLALGFVGILESGRSIERRVRQLIENPVPTRSRLGASGWAVLCGISLVAIPMGFATPATGEATQRIGVVELELLDGGEVRLNRERVSLGDLQTRLAELVHKDPASLLLITGTGNPGYVLGIAKEAGIKQMSLLLRPSLRERLESIQLEGLRMESLPLSKAIAVLFHACEAANPGVLLFNDHMLQVERQSEPIGETLVHWRQPAGKLNAREVLDQMTRHAEQPMEYFLIGDCVVFRSKPTSKAAELHTRQFRLNGANDAEHLLGMVGLPSTASPEELNQQLRGFLRTFGVDFGAPEDGRPVGQQMPDTPRVFFSWQKQMLFARGTLPDLAVLEFVLQQMRVRQPQLTFSTLILDADDETLKWVRSAQSGAIRHGKMNVSPGSEGIHLFTLNSKDAAQLEQKIGQRWSGAKQQTILTTFDRSAVFTVSPTNGPVIGPVRAEFAASSLPGKGRFRLQAECTEDLASKNPNGTSLHLGADFELEDGQAAVIAVSSVETKVGETSSRKLIVLVTPTLVDEVGRPLSQQ